MKNYNMTDLRGMLEQLPTRQLDEMLHAELQKEPVDAQTVRMIMKILREREADYPLEMNGEIREGWEKYQRNTRKPKPRLLGGLLKAASILLLLVALLAAVPQEAEAMGIFQRLISWTDSIFELLSPGESKGDSTEYVFQTNHPGLQEVYDTVTELGVTVPVVPMWLDESYELVECKVTEYQIKTSIVARFLNGNENAVYQLDIYAQNIAHEYYKDDTSVETFEKNGATFSVMRNKDMWVAVWTQDNLECSIFIDCQEEELHKILGSIYTMEDE